MNINPGIFKGYDIRAIYPKDINEENIVLIVKAIYTFLVKDYGEKKPFTLVVGTDMRTRLLFPVVFDKESINCLNNQNYIFLIDIFWINCSDIVTLEYSGVYIHFFMLHFQE